MKKGLLVCSKSQEEIYRDIIELLLCSARWKEYTFERLLLVDGATGQDKLAKGCPDVIVSLDMAGFQFKTLLENYYYNILPIRQLHLIMDVEKWSEYSDKDFAINLFLYVPQIMNEEIKEDEERINIRYYSSQLLETKSEMISKIVDDFLMVSAL